MRLRPAARSTPPNGDTAKGSTGSLRSQLIEPVQHHGDLRPALRRGQLGHQKPFAVVGNVITARSRPPRTVRRDGACVAVVLPDEEGRGRPARVRGSAIEIEEGTLARVDQLVTVGCPLGAEISASL